MGSEARTPATSRRSYPKRTRRRPTSGRNFSPPGRDFSPPGPDVTARPKPGRYVELTVVSSESEPAARCAVCGGDIPAGGGITALFEERRLRFKCQGCLGWFAEDPTRFLAGHTESCCQDDCGRSAQTEWTYD